MAWGHDEREFTAEVAGKVPNLSTKGTQLWEIFASIIGHRG